MDFDLNDEQRMLFDGARRYVRERYPFEARRAVANGTEGYAPAQWAAFAEMGWLALAVPEEAGGIGGTAVDLVLLMEALGGGLVLEPVTDTAVLCAKLIAAAGGAARRDSLLEAIAGGGAIVALAHQEETSRSEYDFAVAATAEAAEDGWRLSGVKTRVFHGAIADHWLVTARITGRTGLALFVVDKASRGVGVTPYGLIDGSRAADLRLDQVALAPDALLLEAGPATAEALEEALDFALLAQTAAMVGSMEAVMAMTSDYLKTRIQYGQPLARFQALQHRMSEMFVETDQVRAILSQALAAVLEGDPDRRRRAVSAAKVLTTQASLFVAGQGIQLHGGIGTTDEYAVGHHYKAAVAYDLRLGPADFHIKRATAGREPWISAVLGAHHAA